MLTEQRYNIRELLPYIDWTYFFHAWEVPAKSNEAQTLKEEAMQMMQTLEADGRPIAKGRVGLFSAGSQGDDIVLATDDGQTAAIPCLRQQHPTDGGPNLCLADFVKPWGAQGGEDTVGVFATMVDYDPDAQWHHDAYLRMMAQTLCDRLAEAAACRLHQEVRTTIWGYAKDEQLTVSEIISERQRGIRPAVGYPSLPDQSVNFLIDPLIGMTQMGITLTENGAMRPHASVSGLMIAHPESRYFAVGQIDRQQVEDYAARRRIPTQRIMKFIKPTSITT